jgi:hypothetical protein
LGLWRQHTLWLIALQARVFVQGGVRRRGARGLIGGFLVMRATRDGWAEIDPFAGRLIAQQQVLIGMRLLLAAVMLLGQPGLGGPLPAALGPIKHRRWRAFQGQWTRGETTRGALWGMPQGGQGLLQHRESLMNPRVGWRLTQLKGQRLHGLQGGGLRRDQNKQELVFQVLQDPFGTAA